VTFFSWKARVCSGIVLPSPRGLSPPRRIIGQGRGGVEELLRAPAPPPRCLDGLEADGIGSWRAGAARAGRGPRIALDLNRAEVIDNYGEIWIDGQIDRSTGIIVGLNA
jgi:hypothetical protein